MTPEEIKRTREGLGITQEEMATLLGLTKPSVCRYELGQAKPNENTEKRLRFLRDALDDPEGRDMLIRACKLKETGIPSVAGMLSFAAALPIMPLSLMGLTLFSVMKAPIGKAFLNLVKDFVSGKEDGSKEGDGKQKTAGKAEK